MYVCIYEGIDFYKLIIYVFKYFLLILLSSLYNLLLCFRGCLSSLDATCIQVLPRNFRSSSPFTITRTKCPSATFISAAILVCKDVDFFMKRMISLIQIFSICCTLYWTYRPSNSSILLYFYWYLYFHNLSVWSLFLVLVLLFMFCFIYFLCWVYKSELSHHAFRLRNTYLIHIIIIIILIFIIIHWLCYESRIKNLYGVIFF